MYLLRGLVLSVLIGHCFTVFKFSFGDNDDDDDEDDDGPVIFNYNQFLKKPHSVRVDSKSKVETLGRVFKGHIKDLKDGSGGALDLLFLVDSSTSVGKNNFVEEVKFVKKLLSDFTVDVNDTRVSVITFSSRERVIRHIDYLDDAENFRHKCSLVDDLKRIDYSGGGTYTRGALLEAQKVLRNARPEAIKAIFLLTDGFSNGGDPRGEARQLRASGVKIFTFGIQNGNVFELYDMASTPKNESTYILDSFEEFESLANRALHEDLSSGKYVDQPVRKCNRLCVGRDCCDSIATCKCGTHTGKYECLCPRGYYGNGLRGGCHACPTGTYKSHDRPGDVRTCVKCPDENHVTVPGATSMEQCVCRKGYRNFVDGCAVLKCPTLYVPKNGYFVNDKCKSVFNAACGLRCKPGYELRGSSLRICREDGSWSGTETKCIMKTCPALMKPKNGNMICTTDDFSFNTVCRFTCDTGYKLVGSRKRTCLAIAYWTGINTRCREITCRPLPVVRDGSVYPPACVAGDVTFGTTCSVTCHHGYSLVGPYGRQCLPEGMWTPATEVSQCVDTSPPFITCPYNIEADTDVNENTATVSWQVPLTVDNSGCVPLLSSIPAVMPPEKFSVGTTKVTYIAEDLNNNKADCHFYIVVKDHQKPTIDRCFSPLPIVSPDEYGVVSWEEPLFSDNSGEEVRIRRSHAPGLFPQGVTEVVYTAYDSSGNSNNCTLKINVIPHPCEYPPVPLNGNRTCYEDSQGVICSFTCRPSYGFAVQPARQYTCAFDNIWEPKDMMPISDCSALELANELIQPASFTFAGLVACQERVELARLEKDFERKITKRVRELCEEGVDCSVRDMETTCRQNTEDGVFIVLGRDKRSMTDQSRQRREATEPEIAAYETKDAIVTFNYVLTGNVKDNTAAPGTEVTRLQEQLVTVFDNIKKTLEKDAKRGDLHLEVDGRQLALHDFQLEGTAEFTCKEGSVRREKSCAKCPVGTFFNIVKRECESCLRGTFQPEVGQISCFYCPANSSTTEVHATSQHNCTSLCLPGTFSNNTVEPCETCHRGYYQDTYGQTDCISCPKRHTTLRRGVMDLAECKEKCPAGYLSRTGVSPCWPCPRGSYQPRVGRVSCLQCPRGTDTSDTGATDLAQCHMELSDYPQDVAPALMSDGQQEEIDFNVCISQPCLNGATCKAGLFGATFECDCAPGFSGVFCDQETDECSAAPCLNGGTCQDEKGDYKCLCAPGYTGKKCEKDIDDCSGVECMNGGTCVDQVNGFRCSCPHGYTGAVCEMDIDDCVSDPCSNGGTCVDGPGGYTCTCRSGLRGEQCEIDDDNCASGPCQNEATCVDQVDSYICECPAGYEGVNCEKDVDDCANSPCTPPATCRDLVADYSCECPTGMGGRNCDQVIDVHFQLDFPSTASTTEYAMLDLKPDLTSATACFWMRSDDTTNQGTAFSYANEDGDNIFTLTNYDGWVLYVNSENRTTRAKSNDGQWHHVCVLWSSNRGSWRLYVDGLPSDSGRRLASGQTIKGGGVFVIGQEQDSLGGDFNSAETFIGQLSQLNVWSRELSLTDIENLRTSCEKVMGDVISWTDTSGHVYGMVSETPIEFCKECPKPKSIDYGNEPLWTGLTAGSQVSYSCLIGFTLAGKSRSICLVTGEWEDQAPQCARIQCGHPGFVKNGYIEGTDYTFDNRVRYVCERAFVLVGPETRYCGQFGFWEGDVPRCEEIKCVIPASLLSANTRIKDATPDNKYLPRTEVFFECAPGNKLYTDHSSVFCQTDGTWDISIPTCDPKKCGKPPTIDNGIVELQDKSEFAVGSFLQYQCDFGHRFVKDEPNTNGVVSCQASGAWGDSLPRCEVTTCSIPSNILNGNFTYDALTWLSQVTYTCHLGYEPSHQEIIECFEDGEWSKDPPVCEPVRCKRPDDILHGNIIIPENEVFTYGVEIKYVCSLGYRLVGPEARSCSHNTSWSGEEPVCKPISCGKPDDIDFGQIIGRDYTLNNIIRYVCSEGYEPIGAEERVCRETGKWQNDPPVCNKIHCSIPPVVTNGFYSETSFFFQETVTYQCDKGFQLEGQETLTCLSNKQWSHPAPVCEEIKCPSPPRVENAVYNNAENLELFSIGYRVRYLCDSGYEISLNSLNPIGEIECLNTGFWEANLPECIKRSCEQPPTIDNAIPAFESVTYLSVVTYNCGEGYEIMGNDTIRCDASGSWSEPTPECRAMECTVSELFRNGRADFKDLKLGSVIRYMCNEGYELKGLEVRRCMSNLSWSGAEPECIPVDCGNPELIENGETLFESTVFQSSVTYRCNKGYNLVGQSTVLCNANKKWSEAMPTCDIVHCDRPSRIISNGRMIGDDFSYGATISYDCDVGYYIDGVSNERICQENGQWDRTIIVCAAVECPRLSIRNGQTSGFQTGYGTTLTISCKNGYRLVGPATRTCNKDGTWGSGQTECAKYRCPRFDPPINGEVLVEANSHAMFVCLEGYSLNGVNESTCQDNDTWSSQAPTCDPVECPDVTIAPFSNGRMIYESLTYTSVIQFECDRGYFLAGRRDIECYKDGTWSANIPRCEISTCYPPYVAPHSRFIGDDLTYNATIEFFCEDGFKLNGQIVRTCQDNGLWSGVAPTCELIICPTPQTGNVIIVGTSYSYGDVLEYRCNAGYAIQGPMFRNCTSSGQWSGDEPKCVRSECSTIETFENGGFSVDKYSPGGRVTFFCDEGYRLDGLAFKLCLKQNLEWSNPNPVCRKVQCKNIPSVPNSAPITRDYFFLDEIEYTCLDGFSILGRNRPVCTSNGQFGRNDISCNKISCKQLELPENALYTLSNGQEEGQFDESAQLSCAEGYFGRGVNVQRCQADGSWTQTDFECVIVECPEFGEVHNGRITSNGQTFGSVVDIQCDEGYHLVGKSSRKCEADGNWGDEYQPFCEERQCEEPPPISNGIVLAQSRSVGSEAVFTCNEGYRLHGTERRVCREGGIWEGTDPYCRLIFCEAPPYVENAKEFDSLPQYLYNSEARYVCDTGYKIASGDKVMQCSTDGSWRGTVPTCSLVQCGEPNTIDNGRAIVASHDYLSEAQYLCFPGYRLKGSRNVVCDEKEQWKGNIPACVPIDCRNPPLVANSIITDSGDHTYNNEVSYNCEVGFRLLGERVHKCLETGVWSGIAPICEPISCGTPPKIDNAIYTGNSHRYLDKVTYLCFDGYKIKGNAELQCAYDGSWTGERPECILLQCSPPPVFDHVTTSMTHDGNIGSIATFVCNDGYRLIGSATATCMEDQRWHYEASAPFCVPIDCGLPSQISNGKSVYTRTTFGSSVVFKCNRGFYMATEGELRCGATGQWAGVAAVCAPVNCGQPGLGDHIQVNGISWTFGGVVEFECDAGYAMKGESRAVCTESGQWSNPTPECQRIQCRELVIHENGITLSGNMNSHNHYGDRIVLGCADGFRMVGDAGLECMENGQWSSQLPKCLPVPTGLTCPPAVDIEHSLPVLVGVPFGGRATVECEEGYRPSVANLTVVCGQYNQWSTPSGSCTKVVCGKPRLRDFVNVVRITGASYTYGDVITYHCRAGVQPARYPPSITCLADGTWDGDIACGVSCKRSCQHGGICLGLNRCKCPTGYVGEICEHAICILPCLHGGRCTAPYMCSCPRGYEGVRCQNAVCDRPCAHGGKCLLPNRCKCQHGFAGAFCERRRA
ncbi:sushi, von Willebrand factor type A, EGF and pentraxin domain-containing protein 1-like isoform X1 [Mya arenaria]|uniref:sushi, von Willebrand factor type A, EGF and pentraxin domain-containing protein 1-like isoform X1 n=2 Tax=Mya arenaria TaxID=6604 RepID=UPI0022E858CD|nr:sushi, von Willebrand factor type A, EGF and pentraxin domain-containing protein 1-like isoform X1 [Mya arenaria]